MNSTLLRTIMCQYLLLAGIVFSAVALLFFAYTDNGWLTGFVLMFFALLQIIFMVTILAYKWERVAKAKDNLVYMYLYEIMTVILVLAILFWHEGNMAMSLYFFIIPLGALTLIDSNRAVLFSVLSGLFFGAVFLVELFLPDTHYVHITPQLNDALNIVIFSSLFFFVFFFLFWHNKLIHQRQQEAILSELATIDNEILPPSTAAEQENFESLHEQILACFDDAKPYCNPDFSIVELAKMLDSNTTYIYRTLKIREKCNFNTFVNTYRINFVKRMLDKGEESQYTMAHIYTSAGFRHQSTFNLAFKNITGMTPSDYIKQRGEK